MKKDKLPKVGIIGGAGPMAGVQLMQHIVQICQNKYSCKDDADFPFIMLLSYPFANMMTLESGEKQRATVIKQVSECFDIFEKNNVSFAAIACNTLHEFLPSLKNNSFKFINMIEETGLFLKKNEISQSLVLCTETSAKTGLHVRHFPSNFPDKENQKHVDDIIDRILAGLYLKEDSKFLADLAKSYEKTNDRLGLILGCTELPLLVDKFPLTQFNLHKTSVIDPMLVTAEEICKNVFNS